MKIRNILIKSIIVIILFNQPLSANATKGSIGGDQINIKDNKEIVSSIPGNMGGGRAGTPHIDSPVPNNMDYEALSQSSPVQGKKTSLVPCGDENASRTRALVPDDMPNANINQYGQPYMCLARSDNEATPDEMTYVLPDGTEVIVPEPIVLTIEDLKTLGLAPSEAHQERAPHTLKNYNTNFWVTPNVQTFTTEINGVPVDVRATPTRYRFTYGDGNDLITINPGYQLGEEIWDQETPTSHKYAEPGDYQFVVTTYYRGEYSVNGGPWQVMEGEGEIAAEPQLVRVWRVKAGLVADDCGQNPQAWGCPGT